MKVLVPIKRVVDYHIKINVKSDGSGVETRNVKMSMNPFDENALEEAVRLKEKNIVTEIIAVSIGNNAVQETLRVGLALGADRAIAITTEDQLEPLAVAKCLAKIVQDEKVDLIILGKQAIDDDCNQTGQMLAGLLDWPQATFASRLEFSPGKVKVTREVDMGLETLELVLPAVVTVDLRINVPRHPSMQNIMKSKQKPLDTKALSELGIETANRMTILQTTPPTPRVKGKIVKDIKELIDKLHVEAKVI